MLNFRKKSSKTPDPLDEELAEMKIRAAARVAALASKRSASSVSSMEPLSRREGDRIAGPLAAIVHLSDQSRFDCAVADYSESGLRLSLPEGVHLARVLIVECPDLGGFLICESRWQTDRDAGVAIDRKMTNRVRLAMDPNAA
jgi:hypothetical protein